MTDIYVAMNNVWDPNSLRYITEGKGDAIPWMNNPRNTAILMSITSVLSFGMNLYVLIRILMHKLGSKKEYAFIAATDYNFILSMFDVQMYLIDITTLAPAWFILFTHKILRRQIGIFFGLVKYEEPTTIASTNINSTSAGRIVPVISL
uniref:7TM GPCR serpentine receptor class x (Srx) domain-containing protein n=1 Tax=Panagrolaimus superbus TaxID=310955 RepID=A0A914YQZ1_9BILA